jgi:hypothetical protein
MRGHLLKVLLPVLDIRTCFERVPSVLSNTLSTRLSFTASESTCPDIFAELTALAKAQPKRLAVLAHAIAADDGERAELLSNE